MIGFTAFLVGFALYFLVRYRYKLSYATHRVFARVEPEAQNRMPKPMVFMEASDIFPEEEKEAS